MKEMVVGGSSIVEALKNSQRSDFEIVGTEEGVEGFKKKFKKENLKLGDVKFTYVSSHLVQERAKKIIEGQGGFYQRIPSNIFLLCSPLPIYDLQWLFQFIEQNEQVKLLCLDQVTDIHNGAAILRTAAFYGVDAVVFSRKGNFGLTPNFLRIASGGAEWVRIVRCGNLARLVSRLVEMNVKCCGLTEHADQNIATDPSIKDKKVCLVMGAEETGLSNAVLRVVNQSFAIPSQGKISSLNVSVAAAIAMEKTWGKIV